MPHEDKFTTEGGEEVEKDRSVKEAEAKAEVADAETTYARQVELEAAKIEAAEPAVSTEDATARAKEIVGHPDPFNTVGTVTKEVEEADAEAAEAAAAEDEPAEVDESTTGDAGFTEPDVVEGPEVEGEA